MFAVWCPRHRARVLLSQESILALHATPQGMSIGYRCTCGYEGLSLPAGVAGRPAA
ncbi:MAG: hypothetical protein ACRDZ7_19270 [Acidimicrobiia bacterium]